MDERREKTVPIAEARGSLHSRGRAERQRRRVPQAGLDSLVSGGVEELDSRDEDSGSFFAFLESKRNLNAQGSRRRVANSGRRLIRRHPPPIPDQNLDAPPDPHAIPAEDSESESSDEEGSSDEEENLGSPSSPTSTVSSEAQLSTAGPQTTALAATSTCPPGGTVTPMGKSSHFPKGLKSTPEKVGLVIGLTVGAALIVFLVVYLMLRRKYGSNYTVQSCLSRRGQRRQPSRPFGPVTEKSWASVNGTTKTKDGKWAIPSELSLARENSFTKPTVKPDLESNRANRPPSLTRRLLRAPLSSNPLSPVIPSYYSKRSSATKSTGDSGTTSTTEPQSPAAAARPINSRLTISTESSEPLSDFDAQDLEKQTHIEAIPPARTRKPGVSYFSWSTTPTTPGTATTRSNRDTFMTEDNETPRFRTIDSWVNQQSRRQNGLLDKHPSVSFVPPPIPDSNPIARYPPYPPTPPIPRKGRDVLSEMRPTATASGSPQTPHAGSDSMGVGGIVKPQRATFQSTMSKHNRELSSTTVSTLPVFRQHPGEEIKFGRGQRARSSSLRKLTQWSFS